MSKNFTTITPLGIMPREIAIEAIHDHLLMIDLNPLVIERHLMDKAPKVATPEEYHCKWYEITDKVSYLPGVKGKVTYTACFHDLTNGLQTHVHAPLGVDIRSKWLIGGSLPGEPLETTELGLDIPKEGLYLREDVSLKCNFTLSGFVKKNLKQSHETLKARLVERAHNDHRKVHNDRLSTLTGGSQTSLPSSVAPSIGRTPSMASQHQIPQQGLQPAPGQIPGFTQQQFPPGALPQIQPGSPFNAGQFPTGAYAPPQGYDPRLSTLSNSSQGSSNPYSPQPFPGSGHHQQIDPSYQNMNPYQYPQGAVPSPPIPGQHVPYQYAQQYPAVGPGGVILPPGYVAANQQRVELGGDQNYYAPGQDQKGVVPGQPRQQGTPTPGQQQSPYPPPQQGQQQQQQVHQVQQQGPVELA